MTRTPLFLRKEDVDAVAEALETALDHAMIGVLNFSYDFNFSAVGAALRILREESGHEIVLVQTLDA